jgi:hypothetical protein
VLPNYKRILSNKHSQIAIAYSVISDHQMASLIQQEKSTKLQPFFSDKRAPNQHSLFSDKIVPNYQQLFSNKRTPNGSNNLAMLVMSCWHHQAKTRGYDVPYSTYWRSNKESNHGIDTDDEGLTQGWVPLRNAVTGTISKTVEWRMYNTTTG